MSQRAASSDSFVEPQASAGAQTPGAFTHEALFYAGIDDFVDRVGSFIAEGVARDEPALVVVGAQKIGRLRAALGDAAARVEFADMATVGRNPARMIPAWRDFVESCGGERPFRGVAEPIWAGRTPAEVIECERHEALLNLAFADTKSFWLACPYDTTTLADAVLDEAQRNHPHVSNRGDRRVGFRGLDAIAHPFDAPLPRPPACAAIVPVTSASLPRLRRLVARRARDAGFDPAQRDDMVFVANEIATNSLRHGGGSGVFKLWEDGDAIVCQTTDAGRIANAMAGRERPALDEGGFGLWLANQLCDLVQIRTFTNGSVVRVRMRRERR